MDSARLPSLSQLVVAGYVYVLRDGPRFKVGFSRTRSGIDRRSRDCRASVVHVIPTRYPPSHVEYVINHHLAHKRLPPQGSKPGDKREWFALDHDDLAWIERLAQALAAERIDHR
jgi:hypothetical protein